MARVRGALLFVVIVGGLAVLVGDRLSWAWRGSLVFLLVAIGLVEMITATQSLRVGNGRRKQLLEVGLGAAAVVAGVLVTDSWRWVAAGAWVVGVVVVFAELWPIEGDATPD